MTFLLPKPDEFNFSTLNSSFSSFSFIECYLKSDGILVLKLIRHNLGVNTCCEVTEGLYKQFLAQDDKFRSSLPPIPSYIPAPEEGEGEEEEEKKTPTSPPPPSIAHALPVPHLASPTPLQLEQLVDEARSLRLIPSTASRFNNGALPTLTESSSSPRSGRDLELEDEEQSLLKERVTTPV